jgi:hypothetical protein
VTDGLSRVYKPDNAKMNTADLNTADTANARGPNEDAKYKQQERQLNTEKRATQLWLLLETHSQRLACELMANTINCPATSAHQFKQSKIMAILMNALETEDFVDKQERRRAARSSYFVGRLRDQSRLIVQDIRGNRWNMKLSTHMTVADIKDTIRLSQCPLLGRENLAIIHADNSRNMGKNSTLHDSVKTQTIDCSTHRLFVMLRLHGMAERAAAT